jgi:hypothetical protein
MKLHSDFKGILRTALQKLSLSLKGFVTIIAFSESGKIRRITLPKRLLYTISIFFLLLPLLSAFVFVKNFDFLYRNVRLVYLEEENCSLGNRLGKQAQQINQLKKEIAELKDFEDNLRAISGLFPSAHPVVGTGDGGERAASLIKKLKK